MDDEVGSTLGIFFQREVSICVKQTIKTTIARIERRADDGAALALHLCFHNNEDQSRPTNDVRENKPQICGRIVFDAFSNINALFFKLHNFKLGISYLVGKVSV